MKFLIKFIYRVFLTVLVIVLIFGFYRTWQSENGADQKIFIEGQVPNPMPSGFHRLAFGDYSGLWKGKIFKPGREQGINILYRYSKEEDRFPFRTYISRGIHDPEIEVLKLDYNVEGSPFWIKPWLEEIVEIEDDRYMGKISYQFLPGFPFTLGFYKLQAGEEKPDF